jgi:hypothetical protein
MKYHNPKVMRYTLMIFALLIISCNEQSNENEDPEFEITEILYDDDDIARASFDSNTNEYLLFFHRKDNQGNTISQGPFIYKVMNHNFEEIRTGEFGSANNSENELWYSAQLLALPDTVLDGIHKILDDGRIMRVRYSIIDLLDEQYNLLNSIDLPYPYSGYTETDDLIAFTFDFSFIPSEETIVCVTYNKSTQETKNYFYQLDSGMEEPVDADRDFVITHNPEQELIMRTPKGVYKLVAEKWKRILNGYFYGGRNTATFFVDSKNRLYTIVDGYAEVYDLNNQSLITRFGAPSNIVGEHPDGDIIIFRHPFYSNSYDHKLFKLRIY